MVGSKTLRPIVFGLFISAIISGAALADTEGDIGQSIQDEIWMTNVKESLLSGNRAFSQEKSTKMNVDAVLQAIDDVTFNASFETLKNVSETLDEIEKWDLTLAQLLQVDAIRRDILKKDKTGALKVNLNDSLKYRFFISALTRQLDMKAILTLLSHEDLFQEAAWRSLISWTRNSYADLAKLVPVAKSGYNKTAALPNAQMIKDIFNFEPATDVYASGRYHKKPRLYMFCRSARQYPCFMVMKDGQGKIWRNAKGEVWSQPALAFSRHNKPATKVNGDTPAGILRIDSVMPTNDQQLVYGKFRRLILNFVGEGVNESYTKLLLPPSSHKSDWWKQASVARDIGRSALRIHGTGLRSTASQPYYPLVPTSGCIAQRENKYGNVTYIDQRNLLDEMMKASGLKPVYANETELRGLIYLIEIDDRKAPVTMNDLVNLGLF